MRHGKKFNHLGRKAPHRKAMMSNMASSLILHKRITTTLAKAKALRKYVEPLITKAKDNTTHSRRVVFSYLQNKHSVDHLFTEVADKVANRPGGYTRIIKLGTRAGDAAEICMMELVDYNELLLEDSTSKKSKRTRRSRRGSGGSDNADSPKSEAKSSDTGEKASEKKAKKDEDSSKEENKD